MKISLQFHNSVYNCEVIIKDTIKTQNYIVNLAEIGEEQTKALEIEVENDTFALTVIPKMADYRSMLSDTDCQDWKDKLAKKVGNALFSMLDKMLLRVGCTFAVSGVEENDIICVSDQVYAFGTFDQYDLLDLIPMAYAFFEASCNDNRCKCLDAFAINRKEVVSAARKIALLDFGWELLFTYPIQVGRIKRLSSNKKVRRTLIKFNSLCESERQKVLDKQEKFMEL